MQEVRENDKIKENIRFRAKEISLMANMLEKFRNTIEILYFLMERKEERGFVVMLVSAKESALQELLEHEKRESDILFEIEGDDSLYALICQDTKIDGGYHFADRLLKKMTAAQFHEIYCVELEVRSVVHKIEYIIYRIMELYLETKKSKKENEIIFKALN
jgi:hypothetical protein